MTLLGAVSATLAYQHGSPAGLVKRGIASLRRDLLKKIAEDGLSFDSWEPEHQFYDPEHRAHGCTVTARVAWDDAWMKVCPSIPDNHPWKD